MTIGTEMLALMRGFDLTALGEPPLHETHVFIMHMGHYHYDFRVEMELGGTGIFLPNSDQEEKILGLEVRGWFADIPVLTSQDTPLGRAYLYSRSDLEANIIRGMVP